jgi:D-alanyl-lipoteichoic acid acyltransferase DltB (MBOAT superfamily)
MLFNSLQFAIFFIIVYGLYLVLSHKWQNRMLLVASCIFYGAWDWRFLSLLFITIAFDYIIGLKIYESQDVRRRKLLVAISILISLGILSFFKYFNFFAASLQHLLYLFGVSIHPRFLNIILPVGISFYTFQSMSYVIDVYRAKLKPTKNIFDFALFVTYFPQLVAGPIERASHLLPQVLSPREIKVDDFYQGCYLIFWGLFQKIFVADNLAKIADSVFSASLPYNGAMVLIALYAFAFQIYCDFAGYSNIARGLGKCMGFDIMVNFNLPYFATNPSDFWQRWHISLSTWLRDYLYIPLGGNKKGTLKTYRNLAITMFLGGLWHGAAWTFVIWGVYQGALLIIHRLLKPLLAKIPSPKNSFVNKVWFFIRIIFFFHLVCLGWLIFRAHSMSQVFDMLRSLFFNFRIIRGIGLLNSVLYLAFLSWFLITVQFFQYKQNDLMFVLKSNTFIKAAFYFICLFSILFFGVSVSKQFIYFQF